MILTESKRIILSVALISLYLIIAILTYYSYYMVPSQQENSETAQSYSLNLYEVFQPRKLISAVKISSNEILEYISFEQTQSLYHGGYYSSAEFSAGETVHIERLWVDGFLENATIRLNKPSVGRLILISDSIFKREYDNYTSTKLFSELNKFTVLNARAIMTYDESPSIGYGLHKGVIQFSLLSFTTPKLLALSFTNSTHNAIVNYYFDIKLWSEIEFEKIPLVKP